MGEHREAARFGDDQVSPLNDHDAHEERRVARLLQLLPLHVSLGEEVVFLGEGVG